LDWCTTRLDRETAAPTISAPSFEIADIAFVISIEGQDLVLGAEREVLVIITSETTRYVRRKRKMELNE